MLIPRSLRAKSVLAALLPIALILVVIGVIGVYTYEQLARDVVRDRDEELARVTAARLAEQLDIPTRLLRAVAVTPELRSGDIEQIEAGLEAAGARCSPSTAVCSSTTATASS